MTGYVTVGERIRTARESRRITQDALADAVGVTPRTIRRWETGEVAPGTLARRALAGLLALDPVTLAPKEPPCR